MLSRPPATKLDTETRDLLALQSVVAVLPCDRAGKPRAAPVALAPEAGEELEACARYLSTVTPSPPAYVLLRDGGLVVHVDVGPRERVWALLDARATGDELVAVFRLARYGDAAHVAAEESS